ncbi:amidohydrolase family protein [Chelativorans sp. AA-79]|uniref:metal-dependent hydrolase family protein n=1 Tax=Chelativorans sp. AA-79 TaxID=3028735 RepID=UPI0023F6846D|nr:amidohydrolase family protein [Chelativorans sp. AA-79]WEX07511.1 amidohydrolase family protein [Chelativorans sp. AA-79]
MQLRLGSKYQSLVHGVACDCHTPAFARVNRRLTTGMSRRSVLRGISAALAASSLGPAAAFAQEPDKPVLFTNVRIFDGQSAKLIEGSNLRISGNKIEALVPAGEDATDVEVVDCGGRVLMPGMIDAHWHTLMAAIPEVLALTADVPYIHLVAAEEAGRTLMRGFTTVRDVGGPSFSLKRAIDEGKFPGPRIFPSGAMISQTSGHGDFRMRYEVPRSSSNDLSHPEAAGISAIADGVPEVLRRVREQLLLGASQIKIMTGGGVSSTYDPIHVNQFTAEEIRAAVDAASDWGTYVCTHVYTPEGIQRALENGVKCIEHGQLADEDTVKMIADEGAWWSLQPFLADEDANPKADPIQRQQQQEIAEGTIRAYELGKTHNVNMAWGTDILFNPKGPPTQGKQLAKLSRWFDNVDVLRMATGRNGELLAMAGERNPYRAKVGVIEPGALADVLVIEGNPLDDIWLVADPESNMKLIMKNGQVHKNTLSLS